LPKEAIFPLTGRGKKSRGDMKMMEKIIENDKKIYFISWMDNKPVHLLSTYPSQMRAISRADTATNEYRRVEINQPTVVHEYNSGMGGTDLQDQKASYYRYQHKTRKWHHRLVSHFMMTSVVNSQVLYNKVKGTNIPLVNYIKILMNQMKEGREVEMGGDGDEGEEKNNDSDDEDVLVAANQQQQRQKKWSTWEKDPSRIVPGHTPNRIYGTRGFCRANCGEKSNIKCVECNVWLCCSGIRNSNCFYRFHNNVHF